MAMIPRLRVLLWCLLCMLFFSTSCGRKPDLRESAAPSVGIDDSPRRPGFETILVFLPVSSHTREVWQSLKDELSAKFDIVTRSVDASTSPSAIARDISGVEPKCLVLMSNQAVNAYRRYQAQSPGPFKPAVIVMSSFLEEQESELKDATGITYEIPGITTFVQLRSFIRRPIHRIGVLHRPLFTGYVLKQQQLAAMEKVTIVPVQVEPHASADEIRRALHKLIQRQNVDGIWVLNDNTLLSPQLISDGWLPVLHQRPVAVVVGVSTLVDARIHFGSFAMLPDHKGLGVQAANLILNLADEGWNASSTPIELPLSVETVVDLPWAREHLDFSEEALDRIDRIVQ